MKTTKKLIALILVFLIQISVPITVAIVNDYNQKLEQAAEQERRVRIKAQSWFMNEHGITIHTNLDTYANNLYIIPGTDEEGFLTCASSQKEKPLGGVYIFNGYTSSFILSQGELNFRTDPELVKSIGEKGEFKATPYVQAMVSHGEIHFEQLIYNGNILAEIKNYKD